VNPTVKLICRRSARLGCVWALLLACLAGAAGLARATTDDLFTQGLEFNRTGQFPEAAEAFRNLAKAQPAAGTLVNLGLAEWQCGHVGAAILAWEQARWIDPFNARAEANLKFAREVTQVDQPQLKWFETVSTWLPPEAWAWLACAVLWLTVGLLVLPGILRWRKTGWHQWLAAVAFGIFLLSLTANFGVASRSHLGFVLKKNAVLQLTPTQDGEVVSTLTAGEPVRQIRARGQFVYVRTLNGAGWMQKQALGLLCPR
jgi:tetratricopeptide (TPR) repeat protein